MQSLRPVRLVVFSAVEHRRKDGVWAAHGGFVREIDIWARIFPRVVVVAPQSNKPSLPDEIPYKERNVKYSPLGRELVTSGVKGKARLALALPARLLRGARLLQPGDIVMARGPESAGFLGVLLTRFSRLPRFARYVDQWEAVPNEPIQKRVQKAVYRSGAFGGPVMIYGNADPLRPHLAPFFTSSVTRAEWEQAGTMIGARAEPPPFRLLFVGRLLHFKGVDVLLRAVRQVLDRGCAVTLDIVGDGVERERLRQLCSDLQLGGVVTFHGWMGAAELTRFYSQAHLFVHSSRKEGYGKVLLEAMAFALPIVGTRVGVSEAIVEPPLYGLLVNPDDAAALAAGIISMIENPVEARQMGERGRAKVRGLLLEDLEARCRDFARDYLKLPV